MYWVDAACSSSRSPCSPWPRSAAHSPPTSGCSSFSALFGLSAVAGPLLGGYFVDHLTWQWAFYINIPVGIAAFIIALVALKLPSKKAEKPIDIFGVIFLSIATTCLIFFTDFGGDKEFGWDSLATWAWGAGLGGRRLSRGSPSGRGSRILHRGDSEENDGARS